MAVPTLAIVDGFEHGLDTAIGTTGPYDSATGATNVSSPVRTGGRSMQLAPALSAGHCTYALGAGQRVVTVGVYVRFDTLPAPGPQAPIITWVNAGGEVRVQYDATATQFTATIGGNSTFGGPIVTTGQWYRIVAEADTSVNPAKIRVTIDNGTEFSKTAARAASDSTSVRLGTAITTTTWTAYFDDWIVSLTDGDYETINSDSTAHEVRRLKPTGDGTHNIGAANIFEVSATGTDITNATTDSYLLVDDDTIDTANTDFVFNVGDAQTSGLYVEHTYEDLPSNGDDPADVRGYVGYSEETSVGTVSAGVELYDTDTTYATLHTDVKTKTDIAPTGNQVKTIAHTTGHVATRPSGGWTRTKVNAIRTRVGWGDGDPDVRFTTLMVEVAMFSGTNTITPGIIDHTLTTFTPLIQPQDFPVALVDLTLSAFAPNVTFSTAPQQIQPAAVSMVLTPIPPLVGDILISFGEYGDLYTDTYPSGRIDHRLTPFDPVSISLGTGTVEIAPAIVDHTLAPFDPDVQADKILDVLGPIDHTLTSFALVITFAGVDQTVSPTRTDHTLTPFTMGILGPFLPPRIDMTLTPQLPLVTQETPDVTPEGMPVLIAQMDFGQGFEDVRSFLRTFTWHRGRARERDRMGAGTAQAVFDNRTGRFDRNIHPEIRPNRPARFAAFVPSGYPPWTIGRSTLGGTAIGGVMGGGSIYVPLFTGRTEGGPMAFSQTKVDSTVSWSLVDDSKRLNRDRSTAGFGSAPELTGDRVNTVLNGATPVWPLDKREIDPGVRFVAPGAQGQGRYDYLLTVAESEGGAFFLDAAGNAIFRDSGYLPSSDPVAYGDGPAERRYLDITIDDDDKEIYNFVTVTAPGLNDQTAEDIASQGEFGRSDISVSTVMANEPDMDSLADAILAGYAEPRRRIAQLSLGARDTDWYSALTKEPLERITVRHRPPYGPVFEQVSSIQGITGTINNQYDWQLTWDLSTPLPRPTPNLLSENASSMETDISDWTDQSGGVITVMMQGDSGYIGNYCLLGLIGTFEFGEFHLVAASQPSVTPGELYEGIAYFLVSRPLQIVMGLTYRDTNGIPIASQFGQNQYEPPLNIWQRISVGPTPAPIGAAKAELVFRWGPTTDPFVSLRVDAVSFKQRS